LDPREFGEPINIGAMCRVKEGRADGASGRAEQMAQGDVDGDVVKRDDIYYRGRKIWRRPDGAGWMYIHSLDP